MTDKFQDGRAYELYRSRLILVHVSINNNIILSKNGLQIDAARIIFEYRGSINDAERQLNILQEKYELGDDEKVENQRLKNKAIAALEELAEMHGWKIVK